ncbi:hypothetical protein [Levilactobacillus fuyuanensis]|uniref:Uncharacterized protein n=1 Tax=Levilactobacillus fuyuanensis TaxID=2486022 RepID=A0ABW4H2L4_9LACO|nr:hypothetical protein [Levilactobacillus fuyuanensis]
MNPVYVKTSDSIQLVLTMLTLSKQLSGELPTATEFEQSLIRLHLDRTPELMVAVTRNFPEIGIEA